MKFLIFALTFLFLNIAGAQLPGANPSQRMPNAPRDATQAAVVAIATPRPSEGCCDKNAADVGIRDNTNAPANYDTPTPGAAGSGSVQDK
jgi:hypothetical protein